METIKILTYYRSRCRLESPGWVQKGTFHTCAGAVTSPRHGSLCLMVTELLVAAYVCPGGHMSALLISVICMKSSAQAGRQFRDCSHSWRDPSKPEGKFAFTRSPAELVGQRMHGPIPVHLASIHTVQHTIGDQGIVTT